MVATEDKRTLRVRQSFCDIQVLRDGGSAFAPCYKSIHRSGAPILEDIFFGSYLFDGRIYCKSVTMAKLTTSEKGLWARDMSVAYLIAADQIDWRNVRTEPKFFLFCHSIELALKGYLLVNGHSEDECRDLGHDIAQALNLALVHGLSISNAEREIIVQLSYEHHKRFSFRYLHESNWSAPSPKNVSRCCRALITAIQRAVYAANEIAPSEENLALTR